MSDTVRHHGEMSTGYFIQVKTLLQSSVMPSLFGGFLLDILSELRWSQREFGRRVDMSGSNVPKIINGNPKAPGPPLDQLSNWADALKLEPGSEARAKFLRLGMLSHAPLEVRKMVEDQEAAIDALTKRIEALEKQRLK